MSVHKLSAKTKQSLARWTPDGVECPQCGLFNSVTKSEELSDHVGESLAVFSIECNFCHEPLRVTADTVTRFRADKKDNL